jgi:hypothetical protein
MVDETICSVVKSNAELAARCHGRNDFSAERYRHTFNT